MSCEEATVRDELELNYFCVTERCNKNVTNLVRISKPTTHHHVSAISPTTVADFPPCKLKQLAVQHYCPFS